MVVEGQRCCETYLRVVRSYSLRMFVGMNTMFAQFRYICKEKRVQRVKSCRVGFDYRVWDWRSTLDAFFSDSVTC